jgi:hypothetical protein
LCELRADRRVKDRLQLEPLLRVAEHALAHARTIEPILRVEDLHTEFRDELSEHR